MIFTKLNSYEIEWNIEFIIFINIIVKFFKVPRKCKFSKRIFFLFANSLRIQFFICQLFYLPIL